MLWGESIKEIRTREPEVASVAVYRPVEEVETAKGERTMVSSAVSTLGEADWANRAAVEAPSASTEQARCCGIFMGENKIQPFEVTGKERGGRTIMRSDKQLKTAEAVAYDYA